jgi:hypothetical protein
MCYFFQPCDKNTWQMKDLFWLMVSDYYGRESMVMQSSWHGVPLAEKENAFIPSGPPAYGINSATYI